jgi:hypothetical protein
MKQKLLLFITCILNISIVSAQVPQAIVYQAVARDTAGNPLPNQNISLRFSVHDSIPGGTVAYKETQTATTNVVGLFNVNLGQGTVVSGTFSAMVWSKPKYLQVELDAAGGSNYVNLGTEQMLSVPYAFYSGASTGGWSLNGNAGTNGTNFIGTIDDVPFQIRQNNHNAGKIDHSKRNVSLGYAAGDSTSNSFNNVFIGDSSGYHDHGAHNTFVGFTAGKNSYATSSNSFFGSKSGYSNTEGFDNSFFGAESGADIKTGSSNSFFGYRAGTNYNVGSRNSFFGSNAGAGQFSSSGSDNIFVGFYAGAINTTGSNNIFLGSESGTNNLSGLNNVFVGHSTGFYNSTGNNNSFIGAQAGSNNIIGSSNCFFGYQAGTYGYSASFNIAIGQNALYNNNVANNNVAIGFEALKDQYFLNNFNPYNSDNVAVGYHALEKNAPTSITTGIQNVAVGAYAGDENTTGSGNTFIGYNTGISTGATANNITCIGNSAKANINDAVRIGNSSVTTIEGQVPFSSPSDGRFKNNITEEVRGLDFILRLRPVVYNFDTRKFDEFRNAGIATEQMKRTDYGPSTAIRQSGFIAQEVETALKESGYDFNGLHIPVNEFDNYSIAYSQFTVPLVKAVQELHQKNEELTKENLALKELMNTMEARLQSIETKIGSITPSMATIK